MKTINLPIDIDLLSHNLPKETKQDIITSIMIFSSYDDFVNMIIQAIETSDDVELLRGLLLKKLKELPQHKRYTYEKA